jgi:DNA-binding HxlR family transcriptional regulator
LGSKHAHAVSPVKGLSAGKCDGYDERAMARSVDSKCRAFQSAIDVLSRPWNALILNVLQGGPMRFSELAERANGPGDKVLSARLKDLEARGLLVRQVDAGPPVKVAYELTRKGRAFRQLAEAIERWGRELVIDERPTKDEADASARRAATRVR